MMIISSHLTASCPPKFFRRSSRSRTVNDVDRVEDGEEGKRGCELQLKI